MNGKIIRSIRLSVSIEYRTRWGERLVLRLGRRRIALHYAEGGIWYGEAEEVDPARTASYRYEVVCDGACIRREWRPHRFRLPEGCTARTIRVHDRWIDPPSDAVFHASAFTRAIFGRGTTAPLRRSGNLSFRVVWPAVRPDEVLAIAGSGEALGDWREVHPLDDSRFPEWTFTMSAGSGFAFKFLIADRRTLRPIAWEEGSDRSCCGLSGGDDCLIEASLQPRLPRCDWRGAGTAIPVFALRSEQGFGIGEFADLRPMIDWAVATGQCMLQLLPINDTSMTGTWSDSYPYNANSSFALHPQFIRLPEAGVEEDAEYVRLRGELNALPEVDYPRVNAEKQRLLRRAFARYGARVAAEASYRRFIAENGAWLTPYAVFCTLRDEFGTADFTQWGSWARYDADKVAVYCRRHEREIAYHYYVQYQLHRQLDEVCRYARDRGVALKGDLPIGVGRTSVDAWLAPELFHLDMQAGAPPDAFSQTGQNWGFPTYDWERMAQDGYAWWRARLRKMADYFDAFRIDHILGFFRIWTIPVDAVRGLLGFFDPALPYSADELRAAGFDPAGGRYTTPELHDRLLETLFGDAADEVRSRCVCDGKLRPEYATQRAVAARLTGDDDRTLRLREGLMTLLEDVLFIEDPWRGGYFHPRIGAQSTFAYRRLDDARRAAFDRLHDDFFYRRHNDFWRDSALRKLPALLSATDMLACGEDLGMIPDCVPAAMRELRILSLEIQRMPKTAGALFADPARYPRWAVCTTSTHDMNPLRAWWEEDRAVTTRFYRDVLGGRDEAPLHCDPELCRRIVGMHLDAPALLTVLPWQDWLSTDGALRRPDPAEERINVPSVPRYRWRYRMHLTLETLLRQHAFNDRLRESIVSSGRG